MSSDLVTNEPIKGRSRPQPTLAYVIQASALLLALLLLVATRRNYSFHLAYCLLLPVAWVAVRHGLKRTVLVLIVLNLAVTAIFLIRRDSALLVEFEIFMLVLTATGVFLGYFSDEMSVARDELA